MHPIVEKVKEAGVIGAGGAGFPSHVKYNTQVEILLANGAECEPLLYKDKELMRLFTGEVKKGMETVAEATGATRSILGIKAKNVEVIGQFKQLFGGTRHEIFQMGDYYPAGDEYVLVYEATGRLIPYGGYPVNIGCIVSNVETLLNVALSQLGVPVTEKFLTVTGAVKEPVTLRVPIGITFGEVLEMAGGSTVPGEVTALEGGAMMGRLQTNLKAPVTKLTGGYIVLPSDHYLIRRRNQSISEIKKIGQSACDQCTYCTEFCPRYLLGYEIEPHKVMRTLGFAGEKADYWSKFAVNCCECNLCSLFSCPEGLDPKQACVRSKTNIKLKELPYTPPDRPLKAHPMQAHRKISIKKLIRKLDLVSYNRPALYREAEYHPTRVVLPLKQHFGAPCEPLVAVGEQVSLGQKIGTIPEGKLGAELHASISGKVTAVNDSITIEAE
ncbi:MAG TPA: 4Fe-4S dicluster domain-containing protein [candidate division Zixibacteria bacterium]|nr:4Fe-4S dicluster domain-containing protein [candidate division Zixibacteria bacterium]